MVLSIYSPQWDHHDSYGILAHRLANYLDGHVNRLSLDDADGVSIRPSPGGIVLGYPTLMNQYSSMLRFGKRVAVTMFESNRLPEGWADALNRMDAVVVPALFLVKIFREAGVRVPIHVVPLGVDEAYMNVVRWNRVKRPYTFLAIADRGMRKGWDLAWHAFRSAFGDSQEHKLILKCREDGMAHLKSADANVEILRADLSVDEMADLYARCDCMVFPTRGEGFGLPPREFAATGGVVLATDWGGTADDIQDWGFPIAYKMSPAWEFSEKFAGKCGWWAEPDVVGLSQQMKMVVNWEGFLARTARIKAKRVRLMYDWDAFAKRVVEIYYDD